MYTTEMYMITLFLYTAPFMHVHYRKVYVHDNLLFRYSTYMYGIVVYTVQCMIILFLY